MIDVIAEASRIKAKLRACKSAAEVQAAAAASRDMVMGWKGKPGDAGAMYHHVVNLKQQRLKELAGGQGGISG